MALLNCSFHNSGSLFSSRQNILKSQPSSFSQLVFVCLGLRRTPEEGDGLYHSSGACDLVHSMLWFTFNFLRFALWVPRNHSPPPAPRYYSFQQLPVFLKSLWDPTYPSKSPTETSYSWSSETDKHTAIWQKFMVGLKQQDIIITVVALIFTLVLSTRLYCTFLEHRDHIFRYFCNLK